MEQKDQIVAIRMTADLRKRLEEEGEKKGLSLSSIVRMICHDWLAANAF